MKPQLKIFTSYWFILPVLILIINDFVLKATYHNWFTGKLSDFVGLFFFPIFFAAFFPKKTNLIFILTAATFIFWKSEFSNSFIHFFNSLSSFQIARVVDITDLLALIVLPFSYFIFTKREEVPVLNFSPVFPIILASFAMMATSKEDGYKDLNKTYNINKSKTDLIAHINNIDAQLNATSTSFYNSIDPTNPDTSFFSIFMQDADLCSSVNCYGQFIAIDSLHSKLIFTNVEQICPKKNCPPLKKCDNSNTQEEILMVLESNFIDLL